ncbi:hypothetical protein SCARD494_08316 [Seiridium cardinale]
MDRFAGACYETQQSSNVSVRNDSSSGNLESPSIQPKRIVGYIKGSRPGYTSTLSQFHGAPFPQYLECFSTGSKTSVPLGRSTVCIS